MLNYRISVKILLHFLLLQI